MNPVAALRSCLLISNATVTLFNIVTEFPTWVYFLVLLAGRGAFSQGAFSSGPTTWCGRASCSVAGPGCLGRPVLVWIGRPVL